MSKLSFIEALTLLQKCCPGVVIYCWPGFEWVDRDGVPCHDIGNFKNSPVLVSNASLQEFRMNADQGDYENLFKSGWVPRPQVLGSERQNVFVKV